MEIFDEEIFDDDSYKLIISIVERGYSDEVIFAAKSAGAKGGVVLNGKGSGTSEKKFFGMKIDPENEVVLILVKEKDVVPIMKAIYASCDYQSAARGMVFCLPVSYVTGMTHVKLNAEDEEMPEELAGSVKNSKETPKAIKNKAKTTKKKD